MSANELKILIELATSMGYTGDELKQFLAEERKKIEDRQDRERERAQVHELENLKLDAETKKQIEIASHIEAQKAAQKETERMRLEAETIKVEAETLYGPAPGRITAGVGSVSRGAGTEPNSPDGSVRPTLRFGSESISVTGNYRQITY